MEEQLDMLASGRRYLALHSTLTIHNRVHTGIHPYNTRHSKLSATFLDYDYRSADYEYDYDITHST